MDMTWFYFSIWLYLYKRCLSLHIPLKLLLGKHQTTQWHLPGNSALDRGWGLIWYQTTIDWPGTWDLWDRIQEDQLGQSDKDVKISPSYDWGLSWNVDEEMNMTPVGHIQDDKKGRECWSMERGAEQVHRRKQRYPWRMTTNSPWEEKGWEICLNCSFFISSSREAQLCRSSHSVSSTIQFVRNAHLPYSSVLLFLAAK